MAVPVNPAHQNALLVLTLLFVQNAVETESSNKLVKVLEGANACAEWSSTLWQILTNASLAIIVVLHVFLKQRALVAIVLCKDTRLQRRVNFADVDVAIMMISIMNNNSVKSVITPV